MIKFMILVLLAGFAFDVQAQTPDGETICGIGRGKKCDIADAVKRGLSETGLRPRFPEGAKCRDIDEQWAISYTYKRSKEAYHGGIDMPAPFGIPMIAVADGEVVGIFDGKTGYRGKELTLRHSPQDTGLPLWTYTSYAHFDEMPQFKVGDRVKMGQHLGPTGNSGRGRKSTAQSTKRRPAIHFVAYYTQSKDYVVHRDRVVVPVDGHWMDPNALYRGKLPFDSASLKALPEAEKKVDIAVMFEGGDVVPNGAKIVWPYTCERR